MYGSSKQGRDPYTLTKIYMSDLEVLEEENITLSFDDIIDYTLMRGHDGIEDNRIRIADEDDEEEVEEKADLYLNKNKDIY